MKSRFILLLLFYSNLMIAQQPSMQVWTNAWHNANKLIFKNLYANNALIFPPNKETVLGNETILKFMEGGMDKVDVFFEREQLILKDNMAFEYGTFKDITLNTKTILGQGRYSITWILEDNSWKILCHTWSMPIKTKE